MGNPFNYINRPIKKVPPELKKKVMNDIAVAKLVMKVPVLFSNNIEGVLKTVIKSRKLNVSNQT